MFRKLTAAILSVILLSPGWLGATGLTLPFALVPLLWISSSYDASRRSWRRMFGWAALTFALWNVATVWWLWNATPVGPVAATLASTFFNMIAFMLFHTVSKKGPKALAYTLLVAGWIATEYWYTVGEFSWPWLILGNGFSHETWLVQWYEYTGVFGGSLWVLLCNILFFEAIRARRNAARWAAAAGMLLVPAAVSLGIWWSWQQPAEGTAEVSVVQPNVDCYDKFNGRAEWQERNIVDLLTEVPAGAQFILLPETAVPRHYWEPGLTETRFDNEPGPFWQELADTLRSSHPQALLVTGAFTNRYYAAGLQPRTAVGNPYGDGYYDDFNTAVGLDSAGRTQLHHKGKLVIGVENTPTVIFDLMQFLVIDLGGSAWASTVRPSRTPACAWARPSATKDFTATSTAISCAGERSSWPSSRTTAGGATRRVTSTCSPSRGCGPSNTAAPSPDRPIRACRASYRPAATSGRPSAGKSGA